MKYKEIYLAAVLALMWCWLYPVFISVSLPLILTAVILAIYGLAVYLHQLLSPHLSAHHDLMDYYELRDSLRTGDIIAFGGTDFFAKVIRRFTKSAYSHVGMVVRFEEHKNVERVFILEALTKKGVVLMPLSAKLMSYEGSSDWFPLKCQDPQRYVIYEYLMRQLGKNYDYGDIKVFVLKILFKFLSLEKFVEDPTRMICSELVAQALQSAGIYQFEKISQIAPGDIVKLPIFSGRPQKIL